MKPIYIGGRSVSGRVRRDVPKQLLQELDFQSNLQALSSAVAALRAVQEESCFRLPESVPVVVAVSRLR